MERRKRSSRVTIRTKEGTMFRSRWTKRNKPTHIFSRVR